MWKRHLRFLNSNFPISDRRIDSCSGSTGRISGNSQTIRNSVPRKTVFVELSLSIRLLGDGLFRGVNNSQKTWHAADREAKSAGEILRGFEEGAKKEEEAKANEESGKITKKKEIAYLKKLGILEKDASILVDHCLPPEGAIRVTSFYYTINLSKDLL